MTLAQQDAILNKVEQILNRGSSKEIGDAYSTLDKHGIPNGAFQDYYLLSLILDLQSKIIAVKKDMENGNKGVAI